MTRDETLELIWRAAPPQCRFVVGGQRFLMINRAGHSVQVPLTELTDEEIAWFPKQAPQPAGSRRKGLGLPRWLAGLVLFAVLFILYNFYPSGDHTSGRRTTTGEATRGESIY
jgi:hypothetical protein